MEMRQTPTMFRIVIAGRTFEEMQSNVARFLNETRGEQTTVHVNSSISEIPFGAPDGIDDEESSTETNDLSSTSFALPGAPTPTPPRPVVAAAPNYGEVDSRGIPWDERVHASSKALTGKGAWRSRRGVEPAVLAQIEAELLARRPVGSIALSQTPSTDLAPSISPVPQVVSPTPYVPPVPTVTQPVTVPPAPFYPDPVLTRPVPQSPSPTVSPAPVASTVVPPPVTSAHSVETFKAQLVPTLARLVKEGKLTNEYLHQLKQYFNVEQIFEINDQQTVELYQQLVSNGLIAEVTQ